MESASIPTGILFALIGALLLIIYRDIKNSLDKLRSDSIKRDLKIERFNLTMRLICSRLKIPHPDGRHEYAESQSE
jgi:hypothetical protein